MKRKFLKFQKELKKKTSKNHKIYSDLNAKTFIPGGNLYGRIMMKFAT